MAQDNAKLPPFNLPLTVGTAQGRNANHVYDATGTSVFMTYGVSQNTSAEEARREPMSATGMARADYAVAAINAHADLVMALRRLVDSAQDSIKAATDTELDRAALEAPDALVRERAAALVGARRVLASLPSSAAHAGPPPGGDELAATDPMRAHFTCQRIVADYGTEYFRTKMGAHSMYSLYRNEATALRDNLSAALSAKPAPQQQGE